jgi:hypothetical protein
MYHLLLQGKKGILIDITHEHIVPPESIRTILPCPIAGGFYVFFKQAIGIVLEEEEITHVSSFSDIAHVFPQIPTKDLTLINQYVIIGVSGARATLLKEKERRYTRWK